MGFFSMPSKFDMTENLQQARSTDGAKIVDVREIGEFRSGHIKDAINIPLSNFQKVTKLIPDKNTPVYLYCASGARSGRAKKMLQNAGYTQVTNMGGIMSCKEQLV